MATASSATNSSNATNITEDKGVKKTTLAELAGPATHPAITQITCETIGDQVHLSGEVPTFYLKQLSQETASRVAGIRTVLNDIKVCSAQCTWR